MNAKSVMIAGQVRLPARPRRGPLRARRRAMAASFIVVRLNTLRAIVANFRVATALDWPDDWLPLLRPERLSAW